jgi:hypothetical protein
MSRFRNGGTPDAHGSSGDMGDLAHPASDASAHVAKARRGGHPQGSQALDLTTHALGNVLTETRIARVPNRRFYDGRIDTQLAATGHASSHGELNDTLENAAQRRALEQFSKTDHRLGVGHLARVDSVDEVALHSQLADPVAKPSGGGLSRLRLRLLDRAVELIDLPKVSLSMNR